MSFWKSCRELWREFSPPFVAAFKEGCRVFFTPWKVPSYIKRYLDDLRS